MRHRDGRILAAVLLAAGLSGACADRGAAARAESERRERLEAEFGPRDPAGTAVPGAVGDDADEADGPGGSVADSASSGPETRSAPRPEPEGDGRAGGSEGGAAGEGAGGTAGAEDEPAGGAAEVPGEDEASGGGDGVGAPGGAEPSAGAETPPADAETPSSGAEMPPAGAETPSAEPPAMGVDALLARAEEAYAGLDRLRAAFVQRIENPLLGRTREGRGVWYQAGRNHFRMDFEVPSRDLYVADGSCLWLYEPSQHDQVVVSRLEEGVEVGSLDILGRLLSEARSSYHATDDGVEEIDGTETRVVTLTPRSLPVQYVEVRLWIGVADHYVRRFRIREENETVRTVTLTRLEPQAPIDPSRFEFAPPAGVPVFPDDVRCD